MNLSRKLLTAGLIGTVALGVGAQAAQADDAPAAPAHDVSPYIDVNEDNFHMIQDDKNATGVNSATLAFLNSSEGSCDLKWDGDSSQGSGYLKDQIADYQKGGGQITMSFGGAGNKNNMVAHTCNDVGKIKSAYENIVDTYGVNHLDFDVEEGAQDDHDANQRRNEALVQLQQERPDVKVDYTLPVEPSGLSKSVQGVLSDAKETGVMVNAVNIMTMDFGKDEDTVKDGQSAIDGTNGQLQEIFGDQHPALGVTFCAGNDGDQQYFTEQNARDLEGYAVQHGAQKLSFWQLPKDAKKGFSFSKAMTEIK
ncbi:glycosyl hydrolase family 18 protein [Kocuria massiliensis]|uniref:glycosyl hydrolase family 18 protein n=1 Tax=Kocuria massiliensis TaxID=1926282 RepID=UPI0022B9A64C|nr:glycosyl hydrolase family 18 protein [Kocuria massiliensis]